jgi:uncharacterized protein (DUF2147 family)
MAAGAPKEAGVWFDETGKGAVKIEVCAGDKLCGRIVWLKDLVNDQGEVLTDKNNPDPGQQTRTICGLPVLGQLAPMPEGGYDGGWVYDPKVGKSYSVAIVLTGADELIVTGYKGVKLLGKSFGWTRAKNELPSCAAAPVDGKADSTKSGYTKPEQAKAAAPAKANAAAKPADTKKASAGTPAAAPKPKTAAGGEVLPWATKSKPASAAASGN